MPYYFGRKLRSACINHLSKTYVLCKFSQGFYTIYMYYCNIIDVYNMIQIFFRIVLCGEPTGVLNKLCV
jgi:hypothetical protein